MTIEKHLGISVIMAFRDGLLSEADYAATARHLLRCGNCRNLLPVPRADQFLDSLFGGEMETDNPSKWIAVKGFFAGSMFGRPAIRNQVFAGLLLFAVVGFSFLVWMQPGPPIDEKLVASVTESHHPEVDFNADPTEADSLENRDGDGETAASGSRGAGPNRTDVARAAATSHTRRAVRNKVGGQSVKPPFRQPAETRGSNLPCMGQKSVDMDAKKTDTGLRLTWNKIPNAAAYTIYLSDLDERLIDQYETESETFYLVTAPLNAETVYRWKLIVVLKNGKRIVNESRNFQVDSVGPIPAKKRTAALVRCVEEKQ